MEVLPSGYGCSLRGMCIRESSRALRCELADDVCVGDVVESAGFPGLCDEIAECLVLVAKDEFVDETVANCYAVVFESLHCCLDFGLIRNSRRSSSRLFLWQR